MNEPLFNRLILANRLIAKDPKVWLAMIVFFVSGLAFLAARDGVSLGHLIESDYLLSYLLAAPAAFSGIYIYYKLLVNAQRVRTYTRERDFLDVDIERKMEKDTGFALRELLEEVRALKATRSTSEKIDYDAIAEKLSSRIEALDVDPQKAPTTFAEYHASIQKQLLDKADDADEKASILLTRGKGYTRLGIGLYLAAILGWQVWAHFEGAFKEQFIYGIASFSLLFIFIEFLSAWYLRQFRHFMETSTYLMKIKAIFDRYMMAYFAVQELHPGEEVEKEACIRIIDMLVSDINWPDPHSLKKPDISFAAEAMTSMAEIAKSVRQPSKQNQSKE